MYCRAWLLGHEGASNTYQMNPWDLAFCLEYQQRLIQSKMNNTWRDCLADINSVSYGLSGFLSSDNSDTSDSSILRRPNQPDH